MSRTNEWCLVSSRGSILFYIAVNPGCTIEHIAEATSLTRRSVLGIVGDLKRAGMIIAKTIVRRHHFTVNMGASFLHPKMPEFPLSVILGKLVAIRNHSGQSTGKHGMCTTPSQSPEQATSSCPRPGCSGSLISGPDGNTCLLCGRDPDATRPEVQHNVDGRLCREPRPGGLKRLRP